MERAPQARADAEPVPTRVGDPAAVEPAEKSPEGATPPPAVDETARLKALAKAAIDADDLARAKEIIDDLLSGPKVAEARVLLDAGRADEALAVTSVAVAAAPSDPRVLLVHAEATLRVGTRAGARDKLDDALRTFLRAGTSSDAWLGAARAARELGRTAEGLDYARRARAELAAHGPTAVRYAEAPERTIALALWNAFDAQAPEQLESETGRELAAETVDALRGSIAVEAPDALSWQRLADTLERSGQSAELLTALAQAFAALPGDAGLCERLERTARAQGGAALVTRVFELSRERAARSPQVWWIPARERFQSALERMDQTPIDEFRVAERDFAAARALDARSSATCLEHEALCRAAVGWCRLAGGDLQAAAEAFRSMEKLERGALLREIPGRLGSGVAGLAAVADAHAARGELWSAAQIGEELRKLLPDSIERASFSGRLQRAAGEQARQNASEYLLAAEHKLADQRRINQLRERARIDAAIAPGPALDEEFRDKAASQSRRANQCFERALIAHLAAWRLKPDDVRLAVDASFIPIVYLGIDLDFARDRLKNAIAAGARQLENPELDDASRARLESAWGDAHELLGVYYLERANAPADALRYFEKSLEIGPLPRPSVEQIHLPRCRKLLHN